MDFRKVVLCAAILTCSVQAVAQQPLLLVNNSTLTSAAPLWQTGAISAQPTALSYMHRTAMLDGSVRQSWNGIAAVGANASDTAALSDVSLADVRLSTGEYAPSEVDLAFPSAGPMWVVGRTRTPLYQSGRIHGIGWYQISQPQLSFKDNAGDSDDRVYIANGGDRYLEFIRVMNGSTPTDTFRGVNGTCGAVEKTVVTTDGGGSLQFRMMSFGEGSGTVASTTLWTYHDPIGNTVAFMGADATGNSHDARWQVWKITNAAGLSAYVGDANNPLDARMAGYDEWGRITHAWDATGRHYQYTYGIDGGASRLLSVVVTLGTSGEVGRAEYDYCDATSTNGMAGDLRLVTVRTPCTANSNGTQGEVVEKTYYRNWASLIGQPIAIDGFSPGPQRSVRMVVRPEGMRRLEQAMSDWATRPDTDLASYSSSRYGYSSTQSSAKVTQIQSEARLQHRMELRYEVSNGQFTTGYDTTWARRTIVLDRTGTAGNLSTYLSLIHI